MVTIVCETIIHASREICFDLARDIDAHCVSTGKTQERAVAGRTSGLIEMSETVTFEAVHFGVRQRLTSRIVQFVKSLKDGRKSTGKTSKTRNASVSRKTTRTVLK